MPNQPDNRGAMQAPGVNLQRAVQIYQANGAYRAIPVPEGQMLFAVHATSNRGVALHQGTFDRNACRQLMTEVTSMGLSGYTVLVDGLITYSSSGLQNAEIRVDGQSEIELVDEDIVKAQMRDLRASKRHAANERAIQQHRPRGG